MKQLKLGIHKDGVVMADMEKSSNQHIAIAGRTGSGKSVAGQKIIRDIAVMELCPIVVFDIHCLFSDSNIFPSFKEDIESRCNDIDAYSSGISIPLFSTLKYANGDEEDRLDITSSIADVLGNALNLGSRQRERLYDAVEYVADMNTYEQYGIKALDKALEMIGDDKASAIHNKLYYIFKRNIFQDGSVFIRNKKINVLRLSRFSESVQKLVVEITLTYIWRLANTGAYLEHGIYLFLDECQNLNWGTTGIIKTILSEGRKLGVNLILITQTIQHGNDISTCLLQAGTQLYFSPPENETLTVAKMIAVKRYAYWQMHLKTLRVGECIVNGSLTINGVPHTGAVKIKIQEK